jgi:hypothetical protein
VAAWSFGWPTGLLPIIAKIVFSQKFNFIISSRKMSAGGDSGEGSTPARGPRPYEWHLMQALMPRLFGPFAPAGGAQKHAAAAPLTAAAAGLSH